MSRSSACRSSVAALLQLCCSTGVITLRLSIRDAFRLCPASQALNVGAEVSELGVLLASGSAALEPRRLLPARLLLLRHDRL
jgi:hypothetical protein